MLDLHAGCKGTEKACFRRWLENRTVILEMTFNTGLKSEQFGQGPEAATIHTSVILFILKSNTLSLQLEYSSS